MSSLVAPLARADRGPRRERRGRGVRGRDRVGDGRGRGAARDLAGERIDAGRRCGRRRRSDVALADHQADVFHGALLSMLCFRADCRAVPRPRRCPDRRAAPPDRCAAPARSPARRCGRSRSDSRGRRCSSPCLAFCSTSRIPTPASRTRASAWNNSPHSSGDKPSEGSSSSSSFGADISARPIATICCSPPLMVRASLRAALGQTRKQRSDAREIARLVGAGAAREGAELEILPHGQLGENAAPLGHQRDAGLDDLVRRQRQQVPAVEGDARPACGATSPAMDLSSVDLPAPFAPSITTISPGLTSRSTPDERLMLAVARGEAADLKHRRLPDRRGPLPSRPARSAGGPSAILRPTFITTQRSQSERIASITCSTMMMVMPSPRSERISAMPLQARSD